MLSLSKVRFAHDKVTFHCLSSQVFRVTYCQKFSLSSRDEYQRVCEGFVSSVKEHFPHLQKKVKIHRLLHLIDNIVDFGPTSSFNTERYACLSLTSSLIVTYSFYRCETFNSLIRARSVYANRLAPSRDIAKSFAMIEYMQFLCAGGTLDGTIR